MPELIEGAPRGTLEGAPRGSLRHAAMGSVALLPELDSRELADLDAQARRFASDGDLPVLPRRAARRLERSLRRARRTLERLERKTAENAARASRKARADGKGADQLPRETSLRTLFGWGTGMLGSALVRVPWHSASTLAAGTLLPFLASGRSLLDGPVLGMEWMTGTPFRFDMWSPYRAHLTTSVNMIIVGQMGSGKSMCLKTLALRELGWARSHRHVIVQSDPKGEWASVAAAAGGQTVSIGHGSYLNPLDVGDRPAGMDEGTWALETAAARGVALRGLIVSLREGEAPDGREKAMIAAACNAMGEGACPATVAGLVDLLNTDWPETADIRGLAAAHRRPTANSLTLTLDMLVNGTYRDAFEHESTVRIDPATPILVFDTRGQENDAVRRQVYQAAISAWVDRILAAKDGLFRIVIAEEGHEVLANPELVSAWDRRMRLSGDWACSCVMLLHELGDLSKFGAAGSEQREKIDGILTKSTVQVIYQQSASSLDEMHRLLPDLTGEEAAAIRGLHVGVGLWRIGTRVRVLVKPVMGPHAYGVFETSERRRG